MPKISTPSSGYTHKYVLDNARNLDGLPYPNCEKCGRPLRYSHFLDHAALAHPIEVGACCAKRLCEGVDVGLLERDERNRSARLAAFLNPGMWRKSSNGNPCRRYRSLRITIYETDTGHWKFVISYVKRRGRTPVSSPMLDSKPEAMLAAFECLEEARTR